jgi:hypothetical protein
MIALARVVVDPERIIRRLTGAPDGVASSDWLARGLGCDADDLIEPLAELANAGRVLVWPAAEGVLGVVLARTTRARSRRRARRPDDGRPAMIRGLDLDRLPDRRTLDRDPCGPPYPGLIPLGERLVWEGPAWTRRRPCRGCGGKARPISVDSYCLMCDRCGKPIRTWGLRHEAEPIRVATPGDDGLAGGTGPLLDRQGRNVGIAEHEAGVK